MAKLRNFLVATNLWVGLSAGAFTLLSFRLWGSVLALYYAGLVCFGTAAGYSYMRWVQIRQKRTDVQKSDAHQWFNRHQTWAVFISILYTALAFYFLGSIFRPSQLLWLIPPMVVALAYPLSFPHPFHSFTSLRSVPGLKLLLISLCWTYVTFLLPQLLQHSAMGYSQIGETIFRTIFIAAVTIPFDVRDAATDDPALKTLPQVLGVRNALIWACFGIGLFQFWIVAKFLLFNFPLPETIGWLLGLEVGYWVVKRVGKKPTDHYISFWVEAIPLYILLFVLLSHIAITNFIFEASI